MSELKEKELKEKMLALLDEDEAEDDDRLQLVAGDEADA